MLNAAVYVRLNLLTVNFLLKMVRSQLLSLNQTYLPTTILISFYHEIFCLKYDIRFH